MWNRKLNHSFSDSSDVVSSQLFNALKPFLIFCFAVILFCQIIPSFKLILNVLFLPFTLVHELGHYFSALFFLPNSNPQIKINLNEFSLNFAQLTTSGLPICFNSIIVMFSGSLTLLLAVFGFYYFSSNKKSHLFVLIRYYLIFGLLADFPNLFPILPTSLGAFSDGYLIWIYLCVLINLPYPTAVFSIIWSSFASIMIFFAYYFLVSTFFQLITCINLIFQGKSKNFQGGISGSSHEDFNRTYS